MAERTVFAPLIGSEIGVKQHKVEFKWFAGMAKTQKQKSIKSLHEAASNKNGIEPILEISSKSAGKLGVQLSAFNLMIAKVGGDFSVECAFQGSKVFEQGGPYDDLLKVPSREAKKDARLTTSGNLKEFCYLGDKFPTTPRTFFYDWLYINALKDSDLLSDKFLKYKGYTDIEFNPDKSINCQAYSAALYTSLCHAGRLEAALKSAEAFKKILAAEYKSRDATLAIQDGLL